MVDRCLVCLDADNADRELLDDLDMTFINAYALYSTHSHTPEKMRLRLIIPLTRTVTPDEYAAVSRRIADDLTLSRCDPTTLDPARLMYWPSTPEDGEFVFRYADQPFLNPDEVLATYADWQDASLWPTTQPVEAQMRRTVSRQEDPLTKRGIIGAFCRAHSITDVLENILSDRYTPTTQDDRYTFVGGSTTGGLVVYDDKYAFSHHATDPAGGKLCNAFDLVRWHLFAPGGTAPAWATRTPPSGRCRNTPRRTRLPAARSPRSARNRPRWSLAIWTRWKHSLPKHRTRNGRSSWRWTSRAASRTRWAIWRSSCATTRGSRTSPTTFTAAASTSGAMRKAGPRCPGRPSSPAGTSPTSGRC